MIKYEDGEILDLLPSIFKESPDWIAFSYCLKMGMRGMLTCLQKIHLLSDINSTPEDVLDYLALELRAPYYKETLDIEKKRELLKGSILWRMQAGTNASLQQVIDILFEGGNIIERPKYSGDPHHFYIRTNYALDSKELLSEFRSIIDNVKRKSSVLDQVEFAQSGRTMLYAASANLAMEIIEDGITVNRV